MTLVQDALISPDSLVKTMDGEDSLVVDWGEGLPPDVLALVAKAGGIQHLKSMRGVCKAWQQGFELGVTSIAILKLYHPVLPPGLQAAQRFPELSLLKLGKSGTSQEWLVTLSAFPKLRGLILGVQTAALHTGRRLGDRLLDADMIHLQV